MSPLLFCPGPFLSALPAFRVGTVILYTFGTSAFRVGTVILYTFGTPAFCVAAASAGSLKIRTSLSLAALPDTVQSNKKQFISRRPPR